jgi:hypothetical protein
MNCQAGQDPATCTLRPAGDAPRPEHPRPLPATPKSHAKRAQILAHSPSDAVNPNASPNA